MEYLDHKELGMKHRLFHFQEESKGNVFWHKNGWVLYREVENYIRDFLEKENYQEVKSPIILDKVLWEKSGHWDKFQDNMFLVNSEDKEMAIKPMSCPGHIQIFNDMNLSYKSLPYRMAEFGQCHRNELSGAVNGLLRMRSFVQDDGHIFCLKEDIESECLSFCKSLLGVYKDFGFDDVEIKFSDRPSKRVGSDELWDLSEKMLLNSLEKLGVKYDINKGEGAFYGPKLEFILKDSLGRDWQCGTLQLDFNLPELLDANYIDSDSKKQKPVLIHRAILGSLERFIAILLEHYQGVLPYWLSPVQIVVVNINDKNNEYCEEIHSMLKRNKVRSKLDISNERISKKALIYKESKIPYMIIIGDKEMNNNKVAIKNLRDNSQIVIEKDNLEEYINKI